jgi:hypothetical protein
MTDEIKAPRKSKAVEQAPANITVTDRDAVKEPQIQKFTPQPDGSVVVSLDEEKNEILKKYPDYVAMDANSLSVKQPITRAEYDDSELMRGLADPEGLLNEGKEQTTEDEVRFLVSAVGEILTRLEKLEDLNLEERLRLHNTRAPFKI